MIKLPAETLILVFLKLTVKDRLECILVCKNWYMVITENILYKRLNFSNIDSFNKAFDLFDEKRSFGCFANDLTIKGYGTDIFSILSMPKLFPNVRNLSWEENIRSEEQRIATDISIEDFLPPHVYHRKFKRWNQFEEIDIGLERFPSMTMLLESSLLPNLTYLCINFDQIHVDNNFLKATVLNVHPVVKKLVKHLKSAPSLHHLKLIYAVLDLDDMEELHTGAAKLKVIDAHCTSISNEFIKTVPTTADKKSIIGSSGVVIARETESTVEKISVDFFVSCSAGIYDINGELKNTLIKWLLYMGCKYRSTEIIFKQSSAYLPEIREFENPILTIISKMSDIKEYHASLYPITKSIMNAMDKKKGRLEHLYLYTNAMESIEAQLQHAGVSKQAKTICYLNIKSGNSDLKNSITLQSILSGLSQRFCSLSNLKIKCTMHHCALIELFQMLPSLLEVFVDGICFDATENIIMIPITRTKIQSLSLTISSATAPNMLQANQVMEFILQSCPLLSTFTLNGSVFEIAILKLCFFYHQKLTKITINVKKVQYYTFSWENEKQGLQWADYDEIAESNDITGRKTHIDIAWRGKNVILDLAKAPVTI